MPIPLGIFWRCKIDEILTYSFYPWFYVWYSLFGFQNFASVCEARFASVLIFVAHAGCRHTQF